MNEIDACCDEEYSLADARMRPPKLDREDHQ
jgi:hypothetical protein